MKRLLPLLLLVLAPGAASAWIAQNGLIVEESPGGFTVPYRGLSGPRDFWCAAGDYVIRELALPPETLIFRTSAAPRRGGDGMSFSLSSENAKKPGLLLWSGRIGVSASLAREFCNDLPPESD